jgi:hypothetical protein
VLLTLKCQSNLQDDMSACHPLRACRHITVEHHFKLFLLRVAPVVVFLVIAGVYTTIIMSLLRSPFGFEAKQHASHAAAETNALHVRHITRVKPDTTAPSAECRRQQQQREQQQQLQAQAAPRHIRALSLACACLVAMDSGLPLAALADVPQQQQQAEKHGLLGRLRQMVSPAGDGECLRCCPCIKAATPV